MIIPEHPRFISCAYRTAISSLRRARIVSVVRNALLFALSGTGAFLLRFDFRVPSNYVGHMFFAVAVWVGVKSVVFATGRMSHNNWRYASGPDFLAIVGHSIGGSIFAFPIIYVAGPPNFPRSIYFLDLIVCTYAVPATYMLARLVTEHHKSRSATKIERVLIYGAGNGGALLAQEIRRNPSLGYHIYGFVDDDPHKQHTMTQRVPVVGTGADLPELVSSRDISQVLIAVPSASKEQMLRMLQNCRDAKVSCKTIPGMADLIRTNGLASQIREVAVEDLLGRNPVQLAEDEIRSRITDEVVLVTGAAGSIGSELCRQLARFQPKAIVGLDISEAGLFQMQQEMIHAFPDVPFIAEVGSIQNRYRLQDVMDEHGPSILYHAAAYKHVPMMEASIFEAVENNMLGTYNVARAAGEAGIRDFVMISSDKAVNPANIMGATKRCAELVIRSMCDYDTKYVSVRFGNVLGSSGSVVPTFKRQIAAGGPVTVTHPEMRRFFMTIPEAAQLVIQASTMGNGGEIFVLDMGEQVKIVDLAKRMILLSGLSPEQDIPIVFTGIRPGEKLYEELNLGEERTLGTYHPKIKIFSGSAPPLDLDIQLKGVRALCQSRDEAGLLAALCRLVPDYTPSSHLAGKKVRSISRSPGLVASA